VDWARRAADRLRGGKEGDMTPSPHPTAPAEPAEEYFRRFHQYQGETTHCGDFSISMAGHIYCDRKGRSADRCKVEKITEFLDRYFFLGYRFPAPKGVTEGGATPGGITAALLVLGIPAFFNPFGTLEVLEKALVNGKMIIVSQGKLMDPKQGTWGHVMLIVGMEDEKFLILDPAQREGVSRWVKADFLKTWWYPPFHPCWLVG
jgi:hypothetical protein